MAQTGTLHDAFINELRDTYDAEKQLIKALPRLAKAATTGGLKEALERHLEETREQVARLEQVFSGLDEKVKGRHCEGMAGIIEEGKSILEDDLDDVALDACIIAAGQRAEHYEMAAYGTLVAWARAMGHDDAAGLLQESLDEEKAADETLSSLAEGGINDEAASTAHPNGDEDDMASSEQTTPGRSARSASASSGRGRNGPATAARRR
jgi:ferritin-like metal-binding protein YciE